MGLLVRGCASTYRVVEFEVLEPATVSLPEFVQQLIVLNRAPFTFDAFSEEDRQGLPALSSLNATGLNRSSMK